MKGQQRAILVIALILVLILTGLTPLDFVHKLGSGCPLHPVKNALKSHLGENYFSAPEPKSDSSGLLYVPESLYPGTASTFLSPTEYQRILVDLFLEDPPLRC